jgi:hypothetical protein
MCLSDKDVQKMGLFEPVVVELLKRLDRADGCRSGYGAETQDHGLSLQAAELHQIPGRILQLEIRGLATGADPSSGHGASDIHHGVFSGKMVVVIILYAEAGFHIVEQFRYRSMFHTTS